jgi:hypothetical protein
MEETLRWQEAQITEYNSDVDAQEKPIIKPAKQWLFPEDHA